MKKIGWGVLLWLVLAVPAVAFAIPQLISYQGMVTGSGGVPVSGTHNMTFALYGTASGGTPLWSETQPVSVANGVYGVTLGAVTPVPATAFAADSLYLGVAVDADAEMSPRQRITSVGYAYRAGTADGYAGPPLADPQIASAASWNGKLSSVAAASPLSGAGTPASPLGIAVGAAAGTVAAGNDPRLSDARTPLPGSSYYIQNGTTPQAASYSVTGSGNVGGDLTVGGNLALGGQISPLRVPGGTAPPTAAPANEGQLYYDAATKALLLSTGSAWTPVGPPHIAYVSGSTEDGTDNGYVSGRDLVFTKLGADSRLRITYSDNLRVLGANSAAKWEIYLDGAPLSSSLKTSLYVDTGLMHRQSTLVGYATGVAAGAHELRVYVSPVTGTPDVYTGWQSTFLLEVEEVP